MRQLRLIVRSIGGRDAVDQTSSLERHRIQIDHGNIKISNVSQCVRSHGNTQKRPSLCIDGASITNLHRRPRSHSTHGSAVAMVAVVSLILMASNNMIFKVGRVLI